MEDRKPLVLVVDDEAPIVEVLGLKLREAGLAMIAAANGREGLLRALEYEPELVIVDHLMPYMSGLELCRQLQEHSMTRQVPALMLSGRSWGFDERELDQTNIVGIISKPFSPREVQKRVRALVGEGVDFEADPVQEVS